MRQFFISFTLLLLIVTGVIAQDAGHTGPPDEAVAELAFMVGDWQVDWSRNRHALDDTLPDEWLESSGVATIQPHLDGHGYLETFTNHSGDERVEGTTYWGTGDHRLYPWNVIWTESGLTNFFVFSGRFEDDGALNTTTLVGVSLHQLRVVPVSDDQYTVIMEREDNNGTFSAIYEATYTRIGEESAGEIRDDLRETLTLPEPPEGIQQFDFFIGEFDLVSRRQFNDRVPQPAQNTIVWINGGWGFMEHWVALWDGDPFESIAISIYAPQLDAFRNVWFQTGQASPQRFTGSGCAPDGSTGETVCKLAGFFMDITAESFYWSTSRQRDGGWTMEFTRRDAEG